MKNDKEPRPMTGIDKIYRDSTDLRDLLNVINRLAKIDSRYADLELFVYYEDGWWYVNKSPHISFNNAAYAIFRLIASHFEDTCEIIFD